MLRTLEPLERLQAYATSSTRSCALSAYPSSPGGGYVRVLKLEPIRPLLRELQLRARAASPASCLRRRVGERPALPGVAELDASALHGRGSTVSPATDCYGMSACSDSEVALQFAVAHQKHSAPPFLGLPALTTSRHARPVCAHRQRRHERDSKRLLASSSRPVVPNEILKRYLHPCA